LFEEEVMNCSDWQLQIAAEMEDPALAEHLSCCDACRGFALDLAENAAALRSIEVDPAAYTAVRARVLEAVRPQRRFAWLWAAAAVAACVAIGWFAAEFRSPVPLPTVARKLPAPETDRQPTPLWSRLSNKARGFTPVAAIRHPRRLVARSEPLTAIKLLTDDPNVVIIWLVDKKGD
jgi:hypothetical protein